ncbi:hypothetical protein [Acinetobacter courvalinii]|uniref:hypothetical protein n=1 Tax=Acinetobacter courvalinii TaxID=280147 RepID=UPI0021D2EF7B|nr:hypothetical protein [Acinetobacter courvalinii]MCU4367337.1 hypothetical protein [Acinetobacter courvalinii]MCU4445543.1 hypothetical protein [Acinetobacter courvalinii]
MFFSFYSYGKKNNFVDENCILAGKACLIVKGEDKFLVVRNKEYPSVSYYDEVKIKEINNKKVQVINKYNDKAPIVIYSNFLLKDRMLILSSIRTVSYPNLSPRGGKQECKVKLNEFFNQPLQYYVDKFIFNLSESEKLEVCKIHKNYK